MLVSLSRERSSAVLTASAAFWWPLCWALVPSAPFDASLFREPPPRRRSRSALAAITGASSCGGRPAASPRRKRFFGRPSRWRSPSRRRRSCPGEGTPSSREALVVVAAYLAVAIAARRAHQSRPRDGPQRSRPIARVGSQSDSKYRELRRAGATANARFTEAVSLDQNAHRLPGRVEARIRRLERATDDLRDLGHRQLFELVQARRPCASRLRACRAAFELLVRATPFGRVLGADVDLALALIDIAVLLRFLPPHARRAAVARDRADTDTVEPRTERSAAVVFVQLAVDDEERPLAERSSRSAAGTPSRDSMRKTKGAWTSKLLRKSAGTFASTPDSIRGRAEAAAPCHCCRRDLVEGWSRSRLLAIAPRLYVLI